MTDVHALHSSATGSSLHVPGYRQATDPGAVGAGRYWVDTSLTPPALKVRNTADTDWDFPQGSRRSVFDPRDYATGTIGAGDASVDTTAVNLALADAFNAQPGARARGGTVLLYSSQLTASSPLIVGEGVSLVGAGSRSSTIIPSADFSGDAMIVNDPANAPQAGRQQIQAVKNLRLYGNDVVGVNGIHFTSFGQPSCIRDVFVDQFTGGYGIKLSETAAGGQSGGMFIANTWVKNIGSYCIWLDGFLGHVIMDGVHVEYWGQLDTPVVYPGIFVDGSTSLFGSATRSHDIRRVHCETSVPAIVVCLKNALECHIDGVYSTVQDTDTTYVQFLGDSAYTARNIVENVKNVAGSTAVDDQTYGNTISSGCQYYSQGTLRARGEVRGGTVLGGTSVTAGTDTGAAGGIIAANGQATVTPKVQWQDTSVVRWEAAVNNATHAWQLRAYDAAGVLVDAPITVGETGNMALARPVVITDPTAQFGYTTGAGGAVTQATDKSTGVTMNTPSGLITMNAALLAAGTAVSFTLTNSRITAGTTQVLVTHEAGGTAAAYAFAAFPADGSAVITVRNITAGDLSEAIKLRVTLSVTATT